MALSYSINAPAVTPAVAPAIATAVTPLLSIGLILVVSSRDRIRVTVSIGDCQARVSSTLTVFFKVEHPSEEEDTRA